MTLKEEHDRDEEEYRCCPATMDVCAGMTKVTPGGKEVDPKNLKVTTDEDEGEDEEDEDLEIEAKDSQKDSSPVETDHQQEEEEEERRRNDVRKRILSTGKLSAGSCFLSPGSDISSSNSSILIKYNLDYILLGPSKKQDKLRPSLVSSVLQKLSTVFS